MALGVVRLKASAVLAFAAAACLLAGAARAQAPAADVELADLPSHPWVVVPPSWSPEAYFTNLKDGASVESPFVARFGLSMRGIVPAGKTAGRAGHHHLLIDQPLPLDFKKPLPFTEKYVHFGRGQMEAVVALPPGSYTLRLVLADQGHIPYFVYSKPMRITVTKQNKDVKPADVPGPARIEVLGATERAGVQPPLRMQFHASGYNVSHAGPKVDGTGHFRLTLERSGQKSEVIELDGGQTEVWLSPPRGDYSARLELIGNGDGKPMARAAPVSLSVVP